MTAIAGRLVTRDGWPLPEVPVTAVSVDGSQAARGLSDGTGDFRLAVRAGEYTVIVVAPGHQPLATSVVVPDGSDVVVGALVPVDTTRTVDVPPPGRWEIDPAHSIVRASARHLGFSRVEGRFFDFSGSVLVRTPVESSAVEVRIATASITTGNDLRDGHLRSGDFLDVERFPELVYRSTGCAPAPGGRWRVDGQLTLRDVTRPVPLDMEFLGVGPDPWGGTRAGFTAQAELARRDYEMSWNMGLSNHLALVGPTLRIDLDVQAVLQPDR